MNSNKRFKRVFILGAGSNRCYGFPTGGELRNLIITDKIQGLDSDEFRIYDEFVVFFRESGMQSVDRFLEQNPKYQDIGKKVIAWEITRREDPNVFKSLTYTDIKNQGPVEVTDHWYFYLFNRILQEIQILKEEDISFINFNYDRSLEYYFHQSIVHTFLMKSNQSDPHNWITETNQLTKYRKLFNIQHVYGEIGLLFSNTSKELIRAYSSPKKFEDLNSFCQGIHLVENRLDNQSHFKGLQKIVREADVIYCIGFGFDTLNMKRIGLNQDNLKCQAIFSTSVDLGLAERIFILSQIPSSNRTQFGWYNPQKNITGFLRDLYVQDNKFIDIICRQARQEDNIFIL